MLAAVLLLMGASKQATSNSRSAPRGPTSCAQIEVIDEEATDVSATSPNGKYTVCVKEDREDNDGKRYTSVYLSKAGHSRRIKRYKDIGATSVLDWASDSSAFVWNWTAGGSVGEWNTELFDMKSGRFLPVDKSVVKDFHDRMFQACRGDAVDINEFFLKWAGHNSLLIAIQASHGGQDCRRPHPTDVYQVVIPSGRIIKRLQGTEREAISKEFGWL